jgi:hypothetical protein
MGQRPSTQATFFPTFSPTASSLLPLPGAQVLFPYADIDLANPNASGSVGTAVLGAAASDFLGQSVSGAGDVNGDGFNDLIMGAPYVGMINPDIKSSEGAVYVILGKPGGSSTVDLAGFVSSDSTGFIVQGAAASDNLGYSVSGAGDMNNDGFDDVIMGARGASNYAGAVYVIFGKAGGFANVDLAAFVSSDSTGFIVQGAAASFLGQSVSGAGDVNNDGFDDVIMGAIAVAPNDRSFAGAVYVIFGKAGWIRDCKLGGLCFQRFHWFHRAGCCTGRQPWQIRQRRRRRER